jgi:YD repeat-containing protein
MACAIALIVLQCERTRAFHYETREKYFLGLVVGDNVFVKRLGYVLLVSLSIGSVAIAAGVEGRSAARPRDVNVPRSRVSGTQVAFAPFETPQPTRSPLVTSGQTRAPLPVKRLNSVGNPAPLNAPSLAQVESELAPATSGGPSSIFVEVLPTYPIPAAADPYTNSANNVNQPDHRTTLSVGTRAALRSRTRHLMGQQIVTVGGPNITGTNSWWAFGSGNISGVGAYRVNVATGNLLVQGGDASVPHRGMTLGFGRTYNSYSQHDWNNTDQSGVNNYGDGWTNSFDMRIAQNSLSSGSGVSVYDASGARYDYQQTCAPTCIYTLYAPVGQRSILTFDPVKGWYYWTTKAGVVFMFHNLTDNAGVAGRLARIWSRNNNVQITFSYAFDSGPSPAPSTLSSIKATTDATNGTSQKLTLQFSNVPVVLGTRRLLTSLTWPDGTTTVSYEYDTSGRLVEVDEPTNRNIYPSIPQLYQYISSTYLLAQVAGGRWSLNNVAPTPAPGPVGGYVQFQFTGSSVNTVQSYGYINPLVADDSGISALQTGISSSYGTVPGSPYRQTYFAYSNVSPTPSPPPAQTPSGSAACSSTGNTPVYDSDGHDVVYCWDASDRVVQVSAWTGSMWLVSKQAWDATNDLVSMTNPRGFESDAAYDTKGNVIAIALPVPTTSPGAVRATTNITYDASNNVIAVCDPAWSDANGADWQATPSPSSSPCPAISSNTPTHPGPNLYGFSYPSYEPFGELGAVTKPMGYATNIMYGIPNQAGSLDYGQPTQVAGASMVQRDTTSITPTTKYYYNEFGETICVVTEGGVDANPTWNTAISTYVGSDAQDGRVTQSADADDQSLQNGNTNVSCTKTPGIAGSTITHSYTYYPNGQVQTAQSPAERAAGVSSSFAYDADGEQIAAATYFGGTYGDTARIYDADGHLIEVFKPGAWDTRYDYDLSQNGTNTNAVALNSTPLTAHGGFFKTQEYHNGYSPIWVDMKATASDALSRDVADYTYAPNPSCTISNITTCESASKRQFFYDNSRGLGLLTGTTDPVETTSILSYDNDSRLSSVSFNDSPPTTPTKQYTYDIDGRVLSLTGVCSPSCPSNTTSYLYDRDGNLTQKSEPSFDNSDPTTITYNDYPNGARKSMSAAPESNPIPGEMNQFELFIYNYDAAGFMDNQTLTYGSTTKKFSMNRTSAGRLISQADPYSTTTSTYDQAAGRLATMTTPEGTTTFGSYDPEGEVLTFTEPNQTIAVTQNFDSVGNMTQQTPPGKDANGCVLGFTQGGSDGYMTAQVSTYNAQGFDCIQKTITGTEDIRNAVQGTTWVTALGGRYQFQESYIFDADGRMTTGWLNSPGNNTPNTQEFTRGYDALNHLIVQHDYQGNVAMQRWYSPDGRIEQIGTEDSSHVLHWETLHWDGNSILFTTNQSQQLDDVKIGASADYFPLDTLSAQLTVWDRDYTGHMRGCHQTGASGWSVLDAFGMNGNPLPPCGGSATTPAMYGKPIGQGGAILQPDGDGYWDGFVMIQGARDYDSQFRGWIEPDPSSGSDWDLMSQKAYTWNNNNPSCFADPSGMAAFGPDDGTGGAGGGPEWIDAGYFGSAAANGMSYNQAMGWFGPQWARMMNGYMPVWTQVGSVGLVQVRDGSYEWGIINTDTETWIYSPRPDVISAECLQARATYWHDTWASDRMGGTDKYGQSEQSELPDQTSDGDYPNRSSLGGPESGMGGSPIINQGIAASMLPGGLAFVSSLENQCPGGSMGVAPLQLDVPFGE